MRLILSILFCLISISALTQNEHVVYLCPGEKTQYEYRIAGCTDHLYWTTPFGYYNNASISVEWQDTGRYVIIAEYIGTDICSYSKKTIDVIVMECNASAIWFPTSFTPNDDGINDAFDVKGYNLLSYELIIFNRWGEEIFATNDLNVKWNASYAGSPIPEGVYMYTSKWQDKTGRWGSRIGSILLIR